MRQKEKLMKTQHVVGTLKPRESEEITLSIRRAMHEAIVANGLTLIISADRSGLNNAVQINYSSVAEQGNHSPLDFITRLDRVLSKVLSLGLHLDGVITVTVTGVEPVAYRIVVADGELRYKKASLVWKDELAKV